MSLSITLRINGHTIDTLTATNQGPPDGEYAKGDHPGGGGVRVYVWESTKGPAGTLRHRRSDGAHRLAEHILAAYNDES